MKIYNGVFSLRTTKRLGIIDVSKEVNTVVMDSGIGDGLANVWVIHTTAALMINESDPSLWDDILSTLIRLIPIEVNYSHNYRYRGISGEQNAHAHILNCIIKPETTIPIKNGRMSLGKWQSILFIELDGPRTRSVNIQVMGE